MRIVLVDPSRTTRLIVTRMLEVRGHDVLPFANELEALAVIRADISVDGLITSAELTTMSGVELCWETRLLATCRRPIYVLMMSTQYDQRSLIEALDSGADDFIGKPPLAEELYARLRAGRTDPQHATGVAAAGHHRPADRAVQSARFLRAGD